MYLHVYVIDWCRLYAILFSHSKRQRGKLNEELSPLEVDLLAVVEAQKNKGGKSQHYLTSTDVICQSPNYCYSLLASLSVAQNSCI